MIKLRNVSKRFKKGKSYIVALKPLSLTLPDRGLIIVTGETGSGKSTLLSILSGLDRPTAGDVSCDFGAGYASFAFQNGMLLDDLTLKQNLEFALRLYPDEHCDIDETLKKCGLYERADNYPCELSGGEKQRAALVLAIIENKPALFADEPTGNLDEEHSEQIVNILKELSQGKLVVVVTHDIDDFIKVADRKITLSHGEIISDSDEIEDKDIVTDKASRCRQPRFGFREAAYFALASAKNTKGRLICLFVSLFLSFLCVITFSNNLFSKEQYRVYTALKSQGAVCMDFGNAEAIGEKCNRMSGERLEYLINKYDACYFFDCVGGGYLSKGDNETDSGVEFSRRYISDECERELICGSVAIGYNEVAISDYIAEQLISNYSDEYGETLSNGDLIGCKFNGMEIIAIYSTGYTSGETTDKAHKNAFELQHANIFYSPETFEKVGGYDYKGSSIFSYGSAAFKCDGIYNSVEIYDYEQWAKSESEIIDGENGKLETNEIYLSRYFVESVLKTNIDEVVGTKMKMTLAELASGVYGEANELSVGDEEFTVVGVYDVQQYFGAIVFSSEDFVRMYIKYSTAFSTVSSGISVYGCDKKVILSVYKEGLTDNSFAQEGIIAGGNWILETGYSALVVCLIVALISCFTVMTYIGGIVDKNRKTMGMLRAIGVSEMKVMAVYLLQFACIVASVLVLAIVCQFAMIPFWNFAILYHIVKALPVVYYGSNCVGIVLAIAIGFVAFGFITMTVALKCRSSVDLVYERRNN